MMVEHAIYSAVNVVIGIAITWLWTKLKEQKAENEKETKALKIGLQALLRDRIVQCYNHYVVEKRWIPIYAKDTITACYNSYEALGQNGVINDLMRQINELPNYPKEEEENEKN